MLFGRPKALAFFMRKVKILVRLGVKTKTFEPSRSILLLRMEFVDILVPGRNTLQPLLSVCQKCFQHKNLVKNLLIPS